MTSPADNVSQNVLELVQALGKDKVMSVQPGDTVLKALSVMTQNDQNAIVVMERQKLVGIFAEKDLAQRVILQDKDPARTLVGEVMTTKVFTVETHVAVDSCLSLMNRLDIRHLPVMRKQEVVGFLSVLDVVNAVMEVKAQMIDRLEKYVSETWPL